MEAQQTPDFDQLARQQARISFLGELWGLLTQTKKWWLLPFLVVLLLLSALLVLSSTAAAPFIYTLF